MKPVLAVDFDDVVGNFNAAFSAFHNRVYGTSVEYSGIFSHDMHLVYECDEDAIPKRLDEFYLSDEHTTMLPIAGVRGAFINLAPLYEIHIVTNRPASRLFETWSRINYWCPNTVSHVHFTNYYNGVEQETKRPKSVVCQEIGAKVLVEDAPKHVLEVSESGIRVLMPHRPWNLGLVAPKITRVTSWNQTAALLMR